MRQTWVWGLFCIWGCSDAGAVRNLDAGATVETGERAEVADAGGPDATPDARVDGAQVSDSAADVEAGPTGPVLGSRCTVDSDCPAYTADGLPTVKAICGSAHTTSTTHDLYHRCYFACGGTDPRVPRIPDAPMCAAYEGQCVQQNPGETSVLFCEPKSVWP